MELRGPLSQAEFTDIFHKVPRLTVEIIVRTTEGLLLTLRDIEPCRGLWHLPGGTVRFGESLATAVSRISEKELSIKPTNLEHAGYIEYPSHYLKGLDSPVGLVFIVTSYDGVIALDKEASEVGFFSVLPENMHDEQKVFLAQHFPAGLKTQTDA